MYKVYLTDNTLTGHHKIYLETLLHRGNAMDISKCMEFESSKKKLGYILDRKKFLQDALKRVENDNFPGGKILHLLYLDNLYTMPFFLIKHKKKDIKLVGTLHHMPQNKMKLKLLKNCCGVLDRVIVHSEYIKKKLVLEGIENVEVVDYPSFYDYSIYPSKEEIKQKWNISDEKMVFSVLGGTRFDKGLDILLEGFKYVGNNYKHKILLNIVGKEETFKRDFIEGKIRQFGIDVRLELGFVNDADFAQNVLISDYIILPYREMFTGNSGPMTEAIVNRIPILTPDSGNLGYLNRKYNLGELFKAEDSESLGLVLEKCTQNVVYEDNNYKEKLNVLYFNNKYVSIYNDLIER